MSMTLGIHRKIFSYIEHPETQWLCHKFRHVQLYCEVKIIFQSCCMNSNIQQGGGCQKLPLLPNFSSLNVTIHFVFQHSVCKIIFTVIRVFISEIIDEGKHILTKFYVFFFFIKTSSIFH